MKLLQKKKQKGFTIIEVVLVLAIAGLIFMVVFLALPGLQRSQRDTQRKQNLGDLVSQIQAFESNNAGTLPTWLQNAAANSASVSCGNNNPSENFCDFLEKYMDDEFKDPTTHDQYKAIATGSFLNGKIGHITWAYSASGDGAGCNTQGLPTSTGGTAAFAIAIKLENGTSYCQKG